MMKKFFTRFLAALALLAVFALPMKVMGQASVGDVMWSEPWTGTTSGTTASTQYDMISSCSTNSSISYSTSGTVKLYYESVADGTAPELYIKKGGSWTISNIPTGQASVLSLTYKSNNTNSSVTCSTSGAAISGSSKSYSITTNGATTLTLVFSSASGNTRIDDVTLTVTTAAAPSGTTAAPSIIGDTPFLSSTTVTINNAASADGADIFYTLNGDDPTTTISATCFAYSDPFEVSETTTVKAIAKKSTDTNASSVVSKTFTKVTPMSVSEALEAISALSSNQTIANQCVSGIVCTAGSLSNGAITYYISADGTASDRLQVYRGKGLYNADFEDASDIAVGDEVVVYGTLKNFNGNTPEFDQGSYLLSKLRNPAIYTSVTELTGFTYVEGNGPSATQIVSVSGANLTNDISLSLGVNSDFEMCQTQDGEYNNELTLTPSEGTVSATNIYVRLKSALLKANYDGTITLSSTGATSKTVSLSGSVTGQTYAVNVVAGLIGGSIEADPTSAAEGATVSLTANPEAAYTFGSWSVYKHGDQQTTVTVENDQFTMPAYAVDVTATFNLKPTYAITCVADPINDGTIEAQPTSAYEGQSVTLTCTPEEGYSLSSVVITKTSDGSATGITVTNNAFTMPGYAVTATASFVSNTYEGSFVKYSGDITEGDYLIVYDNDAMNNTVSSNKLQFDEVTESSANIIIDPNRNNVWHIANISQTNYWTIYNAKTGKYAAGTDSKNTADLIGSVTDLAKWIVTETSGTYDFENYGRSQASSDSGNKWLRKNGSYGYACYASGTGGKLTLYKYNTLTERTITFNGNGGTYDESTTYTQNVYDGVEATLDANQFTRDGYEFVSWNNQADGNGTTSYDDEDEITVTGGNLTLYAQWAPLYTLIIDNNIVGGSVSVVGNVNSAIEGAEITLAYSANQGYGFDAWNVSYLDGEQPVGVEVTNNKFTMPAHNVTISATFAEAVTYSLVTSINQLVSGKHYIIASGTNGSVKAMGKQNTNNRAVVAVLSTNSVIPETSDVYEFVIIGPDVNGNYTIYDVENESYLNAAGTGSANNLKLQNPINERGLWTISFSGQAAVITAITTATDRKIMRYNSSSGCFSCYGSGQNPIYLYAKDNETTMSYTLDITSYETTEQTYEVTKGGYYLIASPVGQVTPTEANGFLTNSYDLYAFNESFEGEEWRNHEDQTTGGFNLISGRGYLYANNGEDVTITFVGIPYVGNGQVFLSYTEDNTFAGWNLIGNPFATDATIPANRNYYVLNVSGSELIAGETHAIGAKEGIFVKASAAGESVTFTQANAKGNSVQNTNLVLNLSNSNGIIDRAIVRFDECQGLEKFQLNPNHTKVFFTQGKKDYAVVSSANEGEMPVNFKAETRGTYTLNVNAGNVEVSYLHLIDNLTGANVDLLANPSYTFEASTTDYANRFRLVFKTNADVEDNTAAETFAYYNGSEWVINGTGDATLQVIDMMGRVLRSEQINGNTAINLNQTAGIYMLRLINGENVMVQKVVVR